MNAFNHDDLEPSDRNDHAGDLTPSLQKRETYQQKYPQRKPWKLDGQFLIAVVGGVLPITFIYYQNSIRLGIPQQKRNRILVAGLIGFLTVIVIQYVILAYDLGLDGYFTENRRMERILATIVALIFYLSFQKILMLADRQYKFATSDEEAYSSLLLPGFFAVFVIGTLQNMLVFYIVEFLMTL